MLYFVREVLYNVSDMKGAINMAVSDVLKDLRIKNGLSQEEMAEKLYVTRQAVSRWENGETTPSVETLKLMSKTFDVSINALLDNPRQLICQCCGMPLDENSISSEPDGGANGKYCKWCYTDGEFVYKSMEELVDYLVHHVPLGDFTEEQAAEFFTKQLSELEYWKN